MEKETKIATRGRTLQGIVISTKMHKTATIEFERRYFLPKFDRFEKRKTKIKVHNPEDIHALEGDIVEVQECRPLSKTKHFVIIKKLGTEKGYTEKREALAEAKIKKAEEEDEISQS